MRHDRKPGDREPRESCSANLRLCGRSEVSSLRFDEREGHRLGEAGARSARGAPAGRAGCADRAAARPATTGGNVAGEPVEAVVPADLLDQIDLAQQIDAEASARSRPSRRSVRRRPRGRGRAGSARPRRPAPTRRAGVRADRARRVQTLAARAAAGSTSTIDPDRLAGADLLQQRDARAESPMTGALMSAPRSKRDDASVFRPSRLLVRRTDAGLKYALSSTIAVVAADTSESAPPITPAIALRAIAVGDHQHVARRASRSTPSSVVSVSPGLRAPRGSATRRPSRVEVEGVHRLAELEHHVVGDVDDVADRPDAGGLQPRRQPGRRRADRRRRRQPRAYRGHSSASSIVTRDAIRRAGADSARPRASTGSAAAGRRPSPPRARGR